MSRDWQADIKEFHIAMDQVVNEKPTIPDKKTRNLRVELIGEEVEELIDALLDGDMEKIADGAADSIVVILGTMVSYGIHLQPIWDEVHRTNMAKKDGPVRADGKRLKPEGWKPPDIMGKLKEQGYAG